MDVNASFCGGDGDEDDDEPMTSPTPSPTLSPTLLRCKNDPKFKVNKKNCESYLKTKKSKKCNEFKNGMLVADSCPKICKKELCTCADRKKEIKVKVKGKKKKNSCARIKKNNLCEKKDVNQNVLSNLCPVSCEAETKCMKK